jgi:DNA-nicking Smr family endonuclease
MTRKNISDNANANGVFRDAMGDVRPLASDTVVLRGRRPRPLPLQSERAEQEVLLEMANGAIAFDEIECGDEAVYKRPGLPRKVVRKLRRGQYAVQDELDLHGLTVPDAKQTLAKFLQRNLMRGHACVRVIHGKGHRSPGKLPVLKPKVVRWLSQHGDVVAFCSARPVDGGTGALYVLLKR